MAAAMIKLAIVCALFLAIASTAAAATCSNDFTALLPCQAATQDAQATPTAACCSVVEKFKDDPACLCSTIAAAKSAGISINEANAESIPTRCKFQGYPSCAKKI
ncbi:hypothetical protein SELMODRAFT_402749 [Selaginella moellendorffii]|uniref:Bifunctional inhibitor/plant lipid transfer protein/seed storage helical domain-containing protein n=1 Tax=Selaginella moellendorffii TaxID=88036 RepID=D8QMX9_SELML|nr:non-specific lipid-transfer protein [Selaginella moellendorffii]XP_024527529.1 non-specific lipid-transfer protein-like [Selaginella moellendorffii]EFJ38661.1 hypothetical protein SELMODRAFT_402749 [Selaginella moellendorffii]|eukprot:XP_002961122.1 non-specific lipid-transfer protein [Selaginella moellendorffii]